MGTKDYVLVTEYFHPDSASTGQLMTDLAVGLGDRGLDISVYTGQPNYHSGENTKQAEKTTYRGVPVNRISAPQVRQSSLVRRLFNWTVFTVWMFVVLLTEQQKQRELIFVSNPPFAPVAMWILCYIKGWQYTYIVYDFYPDVIVASGHLKSGGLVDRIWSWLTTAVLRGADNVVALGPVMREHIVEVTGREFDDNKVSVIHNWAEEDFIKPVSKEDNWFSRKHGLIEPFSLVYSGNIGANHDLETVVKSATAFKNEPVKFLIIGEGDNKSAIVKLARSSGLTDDTLEFLPYQDIDVLPWSLTSGDISIVSVAPGMKGLCVSSKIYTSLATGQPVLLIATKGSDEARIIEKHDAGFVVEPGDVTEVKSIIERWRSDPELIEQQGNNARRAFERNYTSEHSIDEYYRLLSRKQVD